MKREQIIEILELIKDPPRKVFGIGSKLDEEAIINKLDAILALDEQKIDLREELMMFFDWMRRHPNNLMVYSDILIDEYLKTK